MSGHNGIEKQEDRSVIVLSQLILCGLKKSSRILLTLVMSGSSFLLRLAKQNF